MTLSRRTLLTGSAGALLVLTACTDDDPSSEGAPGGAATDPEGSEGGTTQPETSAPSPADGVTLRTIDADTVVPIDATTTLTLSALLFERATTVVIVAPDAADRGPEAMAVAGALGVPMFVDSPELAAELERLGTATVIGYGEGLDVGGRDLIPGTADASELPDLPGLPHSPGSPSATVITDGAYLTPDVKSHLAAAGLLPLVAFSGHPGETAETTAAVRQTDQPVIAMGSAFVDDATLASRLDVARTAPELPGGGVTPFPARRMVALYGHPGSSVLGMMGEQSPEESVTRLNALLDEYRAAAPGETFIGAFEIITTIASSSAGSDGNYSILSSHERVLPFIEAAEANDIYVVLDLQPGRSTFLEQAKRYEELLKRPWVGLALDPEWRLLEPGQRHMAQIGQVGIDEVNEVGAWLAQVVRDNNLPPKVLTLHQFQPRMILERERLDTSHDEVQYMVHVDGLGSQGGKQATWNRIKQDLPERVYLGWKNFEDEDLPMLTPGQTLEQVDPLPHFISYQ